MLRNYFRSESTARIDSHIDDVLYAMRNAGVGTDEYLKLMTDLERLYEIKAKHRRAPVSMDTIVIVGGNLGLVLIMAAFEQKHVITSKVISLIQRPKSPYIS